MNEAPMSDSVVKSPISETNRLAELGWSKKDLLEVVSAMVRARRSCTENHPPSAPGWMSWSEGCRRMREIALPKGLARADIDGIPWTTDKRRGVRFSVSNTDDGTAVEGRLPQNRSRKGAATDRAIDVNQTSIFDHIPESSIVPLQKVKSHPGVIVSWYLCVFAEGDEVRAEMSCPIETEAGYFADFSERIFLIGGDTPDNFGKRKDEDDGGSEYKITVTRK